MQYDSSSFSANLSFSVDWVYGNDNILDKFVFLVYKSLVFIISDNAMT